MNIPHLIPIMALILYIIGGAGTFTGIAFLALDINTKAGNSFILLFGGVVLSMTGVLLMRIARNRTEHRLRNLSSTT